MTLTPEELKNITARNAEFSAEIAPYQTQVYRDRAVLLDEVLRLRGQELEVKVTKTVDIVVLPSVGQSLAEYVQQQSAEAYDPEDYRFQLVRDAFLGDFTD